MVSVQIPNRAQLMCRAGFEKEGGGGGGDHLISLPTMKQCPLSML